MPRKYLSVVLLAMAALSCASPGGAGGAFPAPLALDQGATGSTVELRQGQKLTVSLAGNPTTGFVWELLPGAEAILASRGAPEFSASGDKLGAGGTFLFTFQALKPGSAPLRLVYRRPFAKEAAPAGKFEVNVVVIEQD